MSFQAAMKAAQIRSSPKGHWAKAALAPVRPHPLWDAYLTEAHPSRPRRTSRHLHLITVDDTTRTPVQPMHVTAGNDSDSPAHVHPMLTV